MTSTIAKRRAFIEKHADVLKKKILEIGASHTPTYIKSEVNIYFLDYFSRTELFEMFKDVNPDRAENLVDIDFVVKEKNFAEKIASKFDLVIANHVIEHIPDIVSWLENLCGLLNSDGYIFLSIPHKEYTFDKIRPVTTPQQILWYYHHDVIAPTKRQVFEAIHLYRPIKAVDVWGGRYKGLLNRARYTTAESKQRANRAVQEFGYVDVHCHVFTVESFLKIASDLKTKNLLKATVEGVQDVVEPGNEFYVVLQKDIV